MKHLLPFHLSSRYFSSFHKLFDTPDI